MCVCGSGILISFVSALGAHEMGRHKLPIFIIIRRQVRQGKRREDNIREWTGLEFAKSQRAVENRRKWRKLVAKSFVVPQ